MSDVMTAPPVVERKCQIEEVFDGHFIELLRLVPRNPFVRALILKLTGKMPGADCESFEQLKDWVETNCEKKVRPSPHRNERRSLDDGIAIDVEFAETEHGRANYSVRRYGSEQFRVGAEDLLEIILEAIGAGGGIGEIVEVIAGKIDEDAWNQCDPTLDDYGEYSYDDNDADETSDSEAEFSRSEIRSAVLAFVQARYPQMMEVL